MLIVQMYLIIAGYQNVSYKKTSGQCLKAEDVPYQREFKDKIVYGDLDY